MDVVATLVAPCPPEELFAWVDDLGRYPEWMEIVTRAEPAGDGSWSVDLRGRLGPLARSKRLRMVRAERDDRSPSPGPPTAADPPSASDPGPSVPPTPSASERIATPSGAGLGSTPAMRVRFERAELDGRNHSPWVLEADVAARTDGSELHMRLHYGGGLFGPVLERLLGDEIERSRLRLLALVSEPTGA